MKINASIISVVCAIALLMQPLFFSFMGLLGVEYEGADSSIVYVAYVVSIAGAMLLVYLYATFKKGILKGEAIVLIFFLFLFVLHALWVIFDPLHTKLVPEFLIFFLLFGVPGFMSAATIMKLGIQKEVIKLTELFIIIIAIGIVLFSVLPTLAGINTRSLAGASYQTLSYYSAFAFGMLLTYSTHLPKVYRYAWVSSPVAKVLSYGLMLGCVLGCFLGGGRGAFLLLIAYLFIAMASLFFSKRNVLTQRGLIKTVLRVFSIVLLFSVFISVFWEQDFIQSGFNRATQFISDDGGIDLERGSSGRDVVYSIAIDYINQRPVFGYGPFGFRDQTIHAHNIFLDLWLQFGLIGFILLTIVGSLLAIRSYKNLSSETVWTSSLLLYPLIMVMFSGTYLHSSIFVFGLTGLTILGSASKLTREDSSRPQSRVAHSRLQR